MLVLWQKSYCLAALAATLVCRYGKYLLWQIAHTPERELIVVLMSERASERALRCCCLAAITGLTRLRVTTVNLRTSMLWTALVSCADSAFTWDWMLCRNYWWIILCAHMFSCETRNVWFPLQLYNIGNMHSKLCSEMYNSCRWMPSDALLVMHVASRSFTKVAPWNWSRGHSRCKETTAAYHYWYWLILCLLTTFNSRSLADWRLSGGASSLDAGAGAN